MFRSAGMRFIFVGVLALLMFIPLGLVSDIIQERAQYSRETVRSISEEWGGAQLLSGPVLVVPVTEDVTYDRKREAVDPVTGRTVRDDRNYIVYEHYQETVTENRAPVYLYPDQFDLDVVTRSQSRHRGIFSVPVYTADIALVFTFETDLIATALAEGQVPDWEQTELRMHLNSNRALRGETALRADGAAFQLEPIPHGGDLRTGIVARIGDPRELGAMTLALSLNGAQQFGAAAVGRLSRMTVTSDWPDP
ncbi:MAG: inner membrane CreD family protein, partial [Pseudomonadota bacterium]